MAAFVGVIAVGILGLPVGMAMVGSLLAVVRKPDSCETPAPVSAAMRVEERRKRTRADCYSRAWVTPDPKGLLD